jgi:hypothetical protein
LALANKGEQVKKLSDNNYVLTLLTAFIKKAGGEVKLSESTLLTVTTQDVVSLLYDKENKEIILRVDENVFTTNSSDINYEN